MKKFVYVSICLSIFALILFSSFTVSAFDQNVNPGVSVTFAGYAYGNLVENYRLQPERDNIDFDSPIFGNANSFAFTLLEPCSALSYFTLFFDVQVPEHFTDFSVLASVRGSARTLFTTGATSVWVLNKSGNWLNCSNTAFSGSTGSVARTTSAFTGRYAMVFYNSQNFPMSYLQVTNIPFFTDNDGALIGNINSSTTTMNSTLNSVLGSLSDLQRAYLNSTSIYPVGNWFGSGAGTNMVFGGSGFCPTVYNAGSSSGSYSYSLYYAGTPEDFPTSFQLLSGAVFYYRTSSNVLKYITATSGVFTLPDDFGSFVLINYQGTLAADTKSSVNLMSSLTFTSVDSSVAQSAAGSAENQNAAIDSAEEDIYNATYTVTSTDIDGNQIESVYQIGDLSGFNVGVVQAGLFLREHAGGVTALSACFNKLLSHPFLSFLVFTSIGCTILPLLAGFGVGVARSDRRQRYHNERVNRGK